MNSSLISNYIFKLTGGLSLTYALLGIVLASLSILSLEHLDTIDFNEVLKEHDVTETEYLNDEETQEVISKLPEIVASNEFSDFFWSMITFGVITNILLLYFGYKLLKTNHMFAWYYIALMAASYSYMHFIPPLFSTESDRAFAFGAAWGIGNMGVSLLLYTHFWFWGPLLAFIGLITYHASHNKSSNLTGEKDSPSS